MLGWNIFWRIVLESGKMICSEFWGNMSTKFSSKVTSWVVWSYQNGCKAKHEWLVLTSVRRKALDVHVTCDADETASFDGIPSAFGAPASLFRLVLSEVCETKGTKVEKEIDDDWKFSKYSAANSYNLGLKHDRYKIEEEWKYMDSIDILPMYAYLPKY